jgi:hypothetical protein
MEVWMKVGVVERIEVGSGVEEVGVQAPLSRPGAWHYATPENGPTAKKVTWSSTGPKVARLHDSTFCRQGLLIGIDTVMGYFIPFYTSFRSE